jgi:hypothetical protein
MGSWARTGRGCTLHSGGCTAGGLGPARVEVLAGLRRRVHLCHLWRTEHHGCSLPRGKRWLWESRGWGGRGACGLWSFIHFIWCHIRVPPAPPRLRISPRCGLQVLGIRGPGVGKRGVSTWLCGAQDQPDRKFQVSLAPGSRITNGAGCFSRGVPTPHPGTLGSGPGPRAHKACLPQGHSRGTRGEACRRPEV